MSNSFGQKIISKLSLKSSQSEPILITNEKNILHRNSKSMEKNLSSKKPDISLLNIKSAAVINPQQESQQHLDAMNKIVVDTDNHLRQALEHAAIRHEQLDELHFRSQEMLNKNENLIYGITNYRKAQERDLFWRRFQYTAFGAITIGIIILLIILSIINKRSISSSQIIDIHHSNQDLLNKNNNDINSTRVLSTSRRRRRRKRREIFI